MFAELREQLAAEQFETKFFVDISWGQKTLTPTSYILHDFEFVTLKYRRKGIRTQYVDCRSLEGL